MRARQDLGARGARKSRGAGARLRPSPATDDFADAREELSKLLERRAQAIEARDEKLRDQMQAREEQAAIAAAMPSEPVPVPATFRRFRRNCRDPMSCRSVASIAPTTICRLWVI